MYTNSVNDIHRFREWSKKRETLMAKGFHHLFLHFFVLFPSIIFYMPAQRERDYMLGIRLSQGLSQVR